MESWQLFASFFQDANECIFYPDNPTSFDSTKFLAHRGGGYSFEGNTLNGCIYGLNRVDGIECDIQISASKTLWLSHSPIIPPCDSIGGECFAEISDEIIEKVDSCIGINRNFTQLESVFDYMANYFPEKYISLDVKAWEPCSLGGSNIISEMNKLAQVIIDLTLKYNLENHVLVESETGDFLYFIRTHSDGIETYLTSFGDFELGASRALEGGFSGISFKYKFDEEITTDHIELLHRKGLKIQLWTVNDTNDIKEALLLKPDFIQTENVNTIGSF